MTFYETLTAAINDVVAHGYDSQKRIDEWVSRIRKAAKAGLVSERRMQESLRKTLTDIYRRMVEKGGVWKFQSGVANRFTKANLKPRLRAELDRRIAASANLITLNREEMVDKTLRRFQGWATSIPKGGSKVPQMRDTKNQVFKAMSQLPFEERRVLIDQGHKLASAISDIVALDEGAIAARWHSNWRQKNYNYRVDHKERDDKIYLVRNSWAQKKGLVKPGLAGYTDQITMPGEEVFCRCNYVYIYHLRDLPADMVTEKGRAELDRVRKVLKQ